MRRAANLMNRLPVAIAPLIHRLCGGSKQRSAPPLSRILSPFLGGTRKGPPEGPSRNADRARDVDRAAARNGRIPPARFRADEGIVSHEKNVCSCPTSVRAVPVLFTKRTNSKTPGILVPGVLLLEIEREERREESIRKTKGKRFISLCSAFVPLSYRETVKGI